MEAAKGNLKAVAEITDRSEGRARLESESQVTGHQAPESSRGGNAGEGYQRYVEIMQRLKQKAKQRLAQGQEDPPPPTN